MDSSTAPIFMGLRALGRKSITDKMHICAMAQKMSGMLTRKQRWSCIQYLQGCRSASPLHIICTLSLCTLSVHKHQHMLLSNVMQARTAAHNKRYKTEHRWCLTCEAEG